MPKLRSISARLVLAILLCVAAACATLAAFSVMQQQSLTRLALDQQLDTQYVSVLAAFDYEGRAAMTASGVVAGIPAVGDIVAKSDRDGLLALLVASHAALKARGFIYLNLTLPPATIFLRVHDPKAFGDDISARRKTVVTANAGGAPVLGVEMARTGLAVFAMTPIMRDGKSIAVADVGMDVGKEFADRIKQRLGVDVAIHGFDGQGVQTFTSTFAEKTTATPDELRSAFAGVRVRRDADIGGHPVAVLLGQIKNFAGEPIAVLELAKDNTAYAAAASAAAA